MQGLEAARHAVRHPGMPPGLATPLGARPSSPPTTKSGAKEMLFLFRDSTASCGGAATPDAQSQQTACLRRLIGYLYVQPYLLLHARSGDMK